MELKEIADSVNKLARKCGIFVEFCGLCSVDTVCCEVVVSVVVSSVRLTPLTKEQVDSFTNCIFKLHGVRCLLIRDSFAVVKSKFEDEF